MREHYQDDLQSLSDLLVEMTRLVGSAIARATMALLDADRDMVTAREVLEGDRLALWGDGLWLEDDAPDHLPWAAITPELAELLGLLAADGYVEKDGRSAQFTNNDAALRARAAELWSRCFLGDSREWGASSGFGENTVGQLALTGARAALRLLVH